MNKGLGRRHAPDTRDHEYLMATALRGAPERPKVKTWRIWWKGDQKDTPMCVGFSWYGMLRALPVLERKPPAEVIYHEAQKLDEWEGEDYDGTSVRGGAKFLQQQGKLLSYGWAWDVETVLQWLAFKGPVVLGTNWYNDMFTPDKDGILSVSGENVGGHAYLAIGYDDERKLVQFQNSWGTSWGKKGRFYLRYADADKLIKDDGEACTALEVITKEV